MSDLPEPSPKRKRRPRRRVPYDFLALGSPLLADLRLVFDEVAGCIRFQWKRQGASEDFAVGTVRCTGANELTWDLTHEGAPETSKSTHGPDSIAAGINRWIQKFPTNRGTFSAAWFSGRGGGEPKSHEERTFGP